MKTAAEAVAYARAIVASGQWWYLWGCHGSVIPAGLPGAGKLGADCQYFVDLVAIYAGFAATLGPELPWTVPYMEDHSTLPHLPPSTAPLAGDIAVFGTDEHTALFTDPGHVVQAYNPQRGLIETTLAGVGMTLTSILRPPYGPQEADMLGFTLTNPIGTLTVANTPGIMGVDVTGRLVPVPPGPQAVYLRFELAEPIGPADLDGKTVYWTRDKVAVLARNGVFAPTASAHTVQLLVDGKPAGSPLTL